MSICFSHFEAVIGGARYLVLAMFLAATVLLTASCSSLKALAPGHFVKQGDAPLWQPDPQDWDALPGVGSVLRVGETHYMYYAATGTGRGDAHIGLATAPSPEGPWQKYPQNPIFAPAPDGAWDDYSVSQPRVYRFGGRYYMYYVAQQELWRGGHFPWRIGLATASSPEGPWTRYSDRPILDVGALGDWDGLALNLGAVVRVRDEYWLWYAAFREHPDEYGHIGLAKASAPGGPWRKHPGNPIMAPPQWAAFGVQEPAVIRHGGRFHMWYASLPVVGDSRPADIGYAFSADGIHWADLPTNPALPRGEAGKWDDFDVSEPFVLQEGRRLYLFYTGFKYPSFASAIGIAIWKP